MKRFGMVICLFMLSGVCAVNSVRAQAKEKSETSGDDIARLVGNWSGESICVDKERFPACHDEQVVYRIVKSADKPETLTITMDKIVEVKPEFMGALDFKYDVKRHTLMGEFTRNGRQGVWEFTVKDDVIEGALVTLPERTAARRVHVKKE